jgi:hypothetical protein
MLFKEINVVYTENHIKHKKKQNAELLTVKAGAYIKLPLSFNGLNHT